MNEYLAKTIDEFLQSKMFLGHSIYPSEQVHKWYHWLYIGHVDQKINKVGITGNIVQRTKALGRYTPPIQMCWTWSIPDPDSVELKVKQLLHSFIKEKSKRTEELEKESGYTEKIIGIPIKPLLVFIRLVLLYTFMERNYIPRDQKLFHILEQYMTVAPTVIKYDNHEYVGNTSATYNAIHWVWKKHHGAGTKAPSLDEMKKAIFEDITVKKKMTEEIKLKTTEFEANMAQSKRVCDLNELYRQLDLYDGLLDPPLSIHTPTNKNISSDGDEDGDEDGEDDDEDDEDDDDDDDAYDDNVPNPPRSLTRNTIIYVCQQVEHDSNKYYRFFKAKVQSTRNHGDTVDIRYYYIDAHEKRSGTLTTVKFRRSNERRDFRDRKDDEKYAHRYGVYRVGDKTPADNKLDDFNFSYTEQTHANKGMTMAEAKKLIVGTMVERVDGSDSDRTVYEVPRVNTSTGRFGITGLFGGKRVNLPQDWKVKSKK